jgi:hypothetical protein
MNYYHPNKLWMEFRDSTRESSPLSTPRSVPDPTPFGAKEDSLTRKKTASIFSGERMSAFTTNQASGAYAPYGMVGVLADFTIDRRPMTSRNGANGGGSRNCGCARHHRWTAGRRRWRPGRGHRNRVAATAPIIPPTVADGGWQAETTPISTA